MENYDITIVNFWLTVAVYRTAHEVWRSFHETEFQGDTIPIDGPRAFSSGSFCDTLTVMTVHNTDHLLSCLTFLTAHYGHAQSKESLLAGLAYDGDPIGPDLFTEGARRAGLKTKIVKRDHITDVPRAVLPAVLILRDEGACVLLSRKNGVAHLYMPDTEAHKDIPLSDLEKDYAGYAIFVHPEGKNGAGTADQDTEEYQHHWFWGLVHENRSIYGMALIGAVFINLFGLAAPLYIMNVYDRVIPNNAIETGWALGIGALAVFVFDLIMRSLRAYLIDLAGKRMDVIVGRRIYDHVLNMKLSARPKSSGSFANMLRDFDAVREFFTSATITGLVDLPFTIFFLFVIFQIGGGVAFILIGLMLMVITVGMILQTQLKHLVRKSTKSSEAKHGLLVETIHGLETIKAIGADGKFRKRYGSYLSENALYGQKSRLVSGFGVNIATFLQQIASVIIVLAGMYLVRDGSLTTGGLIACVILGGRAIAPIGQIANLMTRYHQAGGALKTLEGIMNSPTERQAGKQYLHRPDLKGQISFDNISFQYPGTNRTILDRLSFTINPGEKVGIIGRIGSGKSTIARLIMGLHDPDDGAILLDDTDTRQIDMADRRRIMAYIAQDVVLFQGSVRDNITAGKPEAEEHEILAAAKAAGVHEFIAAHPMGYDAQVGEHGAYLSGGQRQAVALARVLLGKPKIMICDEPTNAMDVQAENQFSQYIKSNLNNRTLILITHKHNLLPLVDRLILLDQGKIVMDGPREEVIAALQKGQIEVQG